MTTRGTSVFSLVLTVVLASCATSVDSTNPYDPGAPVDQQAKGTVKGAVHQLTTDSGVGEALVTLQGTSLTAVTTKTGEFALTGVKAGMYTLVVTKAGYRQGSRGGVVVEVGETTDVGKVPVDIARGSVQGEVKLTGLPDNGGATVSLGGAVGDTAGVPVLKAVPLPAAGPDGGTGADAGGATGASFASVTAGDGRWEIGDVPLGQYFLVVTHEGFQQLCAGLVTIQQDYERKVVGTLELVSSSALARFADSGGMPLEPYKVNGVATYYTNSRELKVQFTSAGAVRMRTGWSEAGLSAAAWEGFAVEKRVSIPGTETDGEKTLYIELRDQCGLSQSYTAAVTLDMTPPTDGILETDTIDGASGKKYLSSKDGQVTVRVGAADALSGVEGYRLTVDKAPSDEAFNELPSSGSVVTSVGKTEGMHSLYVEYRDRAGNISTTRSAEVTLDTTEPTGTLMINGGAEWSTSGQVTLAVTTAAADVVAMAVSNVAGGTTVFGRYLSESPWLLPGGDSATPKQVFVRLKDEAGNVSLEMSAQIKLDQTPPPVPALPAGGTLTNNRQPVLRWVAVTDNVSAVTYEVELSAAADFSHLLSCPVTGTACTPAASLNDGTYYLHVRARDAAGNASAWSAAWAGTVDGTPPAAPQNLTGPASLTNVLKPTFGWDAVGDAAGYRVQLSQDAGFATVNKEITATASSVKLSTPVADNTTWYWRVLAVDAAGNESAWATGASFATDATAPDSPSLVAPADAAELTAASVTLSWTQSAGASQYRVQVSTDQSFNGLVFDGTVAQTASPQQTLAGADGTYWWRVQAQDLAGNTSGWAGPRSFTKDSTPPNVPVGQSPVNEARFAKKRPLFQWSDESASGATGYTLTVKDAGGAAVISESAAANSYPAASDLTDGSYTWTVAAKDAKGNTSAASAPMTFTVDTTGPAAPALTNVSPPADIEPDNGKTLKTPPLVFSWKAVTVAAPDTGVTYHLEVIDDGGTTLLDEWGIPQPSGAVVSFATTSAGIATQTYCWRVQVLDDLGNKGPWSATYDPGSHKCGAAGTAAYFDVDNTPPDTPSPATPLSGTYVTTPTPQFVWTGEQVSGATGYELLVYNVTNGAVHLVKDVTPGTQNSYTLAAGEALADGKTYFFQVRAYDTVGNKSEFSGANYFWVDLTPPNDPTALQVNGNAADPAYVNVRSPTVSWTRPAGSPDIDHYEVKVKSDNQCGTAANVIQSAQVFSTAYLAAALNDGTGYWCVRAVDFAGWTSNWVLGSRVVVDTVPPTTPRFESQSQTIVDLSDVSNNEAKIKLAVTSSDANFKGYQIRGGALTEFTDTTLDGLNRVTFNLTKDAVNTLQIRAVDLAGNASSADFVIITEDSTNPNPPTGIVVRNGNGRAAVSWTASTSADVARYKIYYGVSPSGPFNGAFAAQGPSPITVGNVQSFSLTSLVNDSRFYATVTAIDQTQNPGPHESSLPAAVPVFPNVVTPELRGTYAAMTAIKVFVSGSYAYLAAGVGGLKIVDVSNPSNPVLKGSVATTSASAVFVHGTTAYVGDGSGGLRVVDVTDPANPVIMGTLAMADARGLQVVGNYAYVANGDWSTGGLMIVDVSNPSNPTLKSTVPFVSSKSVAVSGNYAYLVGASGNGLHVIDVTNPLSPVVRGSFNTGCPIAEDVFISGKDAYLACESNGLSIVDVSNPLAPVGKGMKGTTNYAYGVFVSGSYAYIAEGGAAQNGIEVIDISVPAAPKRHGAYPLAGSVGGVFVSGTLVFATNGDLTILDVVNTTTPVMRGAAATAYAAVSVAVSGTYAYVAQATSGLQTIDVRDPANPVQKSVFPSADRALDVAVSGSLAYIADYSGGLRIADVSDPSAPVLKGSLVTASALGVFVSGNRAYLADGASGLRIIDVTNPAAPVLKGTRATPGQAYSVFVAGTLAYVTTYFGNTLEIIDVTDPANPVTKSSYATTDTSRSVFVSGKYAYLAANTQGMLILDVSNPASPQIAGTYNYGGSSSYAYSVFVSPGVAYLSEMTLLTVVDVSNPASLTLVSIYDNPGYADRVLVAGTTMYIADSGAGMELYNLEP